MHTAIIHRHGARHVCKEAYELLKDTDVGAEWNALNVGQLTETGERQSEILGKYIGEDRMGQYVSNKVTEAPKWYSSSSERVLSSGRAFFKGLEEGTGEELFPKNVFKQYTSENSVAENMDDDEQPTIPGTSPDELFRAFKLNKSYVKATQKFYKSQTFTKKAEKEQDFLEEVLFTLVPKQAKKMKNVEMLKAMDHLVGAIECERHEVNGKYILSNKLTESQISRIYSLGRWLKNELFFKLKEAKTLGRPLVNEIVRNSKRSAVSVYSAHDHTLCSILANLGVHEYPHQTAEYISFGAYLILRIDTNKKNVVTEVVFNPEPFSYKEPTKVTKDLEYVMNVRKTVLRNNRATRTI